MLLRMAGQDIMVDATATNDAALGISADFFIGDDRHWVTNGGTEHVTTPETLAGVWRLFSILGVGDERPRRVSSVP